MRGDLAAAPGCGAADALDFASEWLGRPALSADASVLVEVPLRPPAIGPYRLRVLPVAAGQPPCARSIASR